MLKGGVTASTKQKNNKLKVRNLYIHKLKVGKIASTSHITIEGVVAQGDEHSAFLPQWSDREETGSTWSILKDDYMKSSSVMEDWISDEDHEFSDQEVSSDSDSI